MWIDRRWAVPGIALSVLLNVFLIGIVAGHLYAGRGLPGEKGLGLVSADHVRALPPDEKKKFMAAMATQHATILIARKAHQAARRALEAEIAAPSFDRSRVAAGFVDLRQAGAALQAQIQAALVEALATLSPASRAALVSHAGEDGH